MSGTRRGRYGGVLLALLALQAPASAATVTGLCGALEANAGTARVVVLSAFPAELAPLVAAATVQETVTVDQRNYYLATLRGVRVVLGLMGIGMVNARTRAESVLGHFEAAGMIVSGVAGSASPIGDVIVPAMWFEDQDTHPLRANVALRAAARGASSGIMLARCPSADPATCLSVQPEVLLAHRGKSSDPFNGKPVLCSGSNDLFGCDLPVPAVAFRTAALPVDEQFDVQDMETAAAARIAATHHVPWIAFRAVSDAGQGPDFQTYYHLAADNAAAVTLAVLGRLGALGDATRANRRSCALLAHRQWRQAALRLGRAGK